MRTLRHWCPLSFVLLIGLSACGGDDETILLVNVDQGSMSTPPTSISIEVYKDQQGARAKVGSATGIAWSDAKKGLGLKMADSAAGVVFVEASGSPSGVADAVSTTVVAKKSNGPIRLVFRDGTAGTPDAGVRMDGGPDVIPAVLDAQPTDTHQTGDAATTIDAGADGPATPPDAPVADAPDAAPALDLGADDAHPVDLGLPDGPAYEAGAVDVAIDGSPSMTFTPVQSVETVSEGGFGPAVAVDPVRGHVYLAWAEGRIVKVKRWSRTTATWGTTQSLSVTDAEPSWQGIRIGVDGTGKVHVVWNMDRQYTDPSLDGVWGSQASPGEVLSLSPPQKIVSGNAYRVEMGVAASGVAYLVCSLQDREYPNHTSVYTASFDGNTWTTNPEPIFTPDSQDDRNASIAVSDVGTAMVLIDRSTTGVSRTAAYHLSGTIRKDTGDLDAAATVAVRSRVIAANRQGEFAVLWNRSSTGDAYVAKYNPQAGWTPGTFLTNGTWQDYPAAALSEDGTITVAYAKKGGSTFNLAVQSGKLTESMGQPTLLETDNKSAIAFDGYGYDYSYPRLAADTAGNVLLVFHKKESETTSSLWGTRLEKGAWRTPVLLARIDELHAVYPSLDVADSGFGAFAFRYWDTAKTPTLEEGQQMFVGFFQ